MNAGDGNMVETTPGGAQVATLTLDGSGSPAGAGPVRARPVPGHHAVYFVDDGTNTLNLVH